MSEASRSVDIIGFNETERIVLASIFKLSEQRTPRYGAFDRVTPGPDIYLVDADDPPAVAELLRRNPTGSVPTVLVGADDHATGWPLLARPLQWARLFAVLDEGVLPRGPTPAPEAAAVPRAPAAKPVLVVDDSLSVRQFMVNKLEALGFDVQTVASGEEAIALAAKIDYGCIFLDLGLPGIDGFETCRVIKSTQSSHMRGHAPVVILTARHSPIDRWRATLAGCDAYLTKPIESRQMRDVIERVIGGAPAATTATELEVEASP